MTAYPGRPGSGRPAATFPAGRQCAAPGCDTVLSIYNADLRCSIHPATVRLRGSDGGKAAPLQP